MVGIHGNRQSNYIPLLVGTSVSSQPDSESSRLMVGGGCFFLWPAIGETEAEESMPGDIWTRNLTGAVMPQGDEP